MKLAGEYIGALLLAIVGIVFTVYSLDYGVLGEGARIGPGFVPFVSGVLLMAFAIAISGEAWRSRSKSSREEEEDAFEDEVDSKATTRAVSKVFILLLVTVLLLPVLGFLLAFSLFVLAALYLVERERLAVSLMVTAGVAVVVWLVFHEFMNVALPAGLLPIAGGG